MRVIYFVVGYLSSLILILTSIPLYLKGSVVKIEGDKKRAFLFSCDISGSSWVSSSEAWGVILLYYRSAFTHFVRTKDATTDTFGDVIHASLK